MNPKINSSFRTYIPTARGIVSIKHRKVKPDLISEIREPLDDIEIANLFYGLAYAGFESACF